VQVRKGKNEKGKGARSPLKTTPKKIEDSENLITTTNLKPKNPKNLKCRSIQRR
jgi:hypothetical protein